MNWHITGLTSVTAANGQYILSLDGAGSGIADLAGNPLTGIVSDSWLKDDVTPTVSIGEVSPDPTNQTLSSATITFSKAVTGLRIDHLTLTRDAQVVDWQSSQSVTTSDGITWTLNNLAGLTSLSGDYTLTLDESGGEIVVFPGNPLLLGDDESWLHDPVAPTVAITPVTPGKSFSPLDSREIVFSEPVSNFDKSDLVLKRHGLVVPLTATQTLTTSDNITWTLNNLSSLTNVPGKYELSLFAVGSGIEDAAANPLLAGSFMAWRLLLPGDLSADNRVGLKDLGRLGRNLGLTSATPEHGDLNGDSTVNRPDLIVLLGHYGSALPPIPSGSGLTQPTENSYTTVGVPILSGDESPLMNESSRVLPIDLVYDSMSAINTVRPHTASIRRIDRIYAANFVTHDDDWFAYLLNFRLQRTKNDESSQLVPESRDLASDPTAFDDAFTEWGTNPLQARCIPSLPRLSKAHRA
jgi:hypothetical protein